MSKNNLRDYIIYILAFLLVIFAAYQIIGIWYTDDAFISFKYSKNFYEGYNLVYNYNQKVQGYTNFLWIIIITVLKIFRIDYLFSSIFLTILSLFLIGIFSYKLSNKFTQNRISSLFLAFTVISFPNLLSWSIGGGLEMPMFTFFVFLSNYFLLTRPDSKFIIGLLFGICTLIRPEGVIFFIFAFMYLYIFDEINFSKVKLINLGFITLLLPYFVWCYYYYGNILPNTFYAKVTINQRSFFEGFHYVHRYIMSSPIIFLFIILTTINFKTVNKISKYFLVITTGYILYIGTVGGDFMFGYRFFIPIVPYLAWLVVDFLHSIFIKIPGNLNNYKLSNSQWIILLIIAFNLFSLSYHLEYKTSIKNYKMIENGKILAEYLNNKYPASFSIATSGIGSLGFYSNMEIIDVLGLIDANIAKSNTFGNDPLFSHNRSNVRYIMNKKPEIIIFGPSPGDKFPHRFAEKQIFSDTTFMNSYSLKEERIKELDAKFYILKSIKYLDTQ